MASTGRDAYPMEAFVTDVDAAIEADDREIVADVAEIVWEPLPDTITP